MPLLTQFGINVKEITNAQLRLAFQAIGALKQQEFFPIASHRLKVASRALQQLALSLEETLGEISERHGENMGNGQYTFKGDGLAKWLEESEPLLKQTVELPPMKGITWDDITAANAKISAVNAEILEEIGFLSGTPENEPVEAPKSKEATIHASV